ncbi:MAG: HAMP domain-containing protein, partial [Micromonosporaceae bacterium]|nr:HAMP domain-containing protein [Micromonosporaceae bacterium]
MVDTDVLAGHEPRGRVGAPSTVDARPVLDVSSDQLRDPHIADAVVDIIRNYRAGVRLADCLTRHRVAVSYTVGPFGVPSYAPGDAAEQGEAVADCVAQKAGLDQADQAAANQALNCRPGRIGPPTPNRSPGTGRSDPLDQQAACLARAFVAQTADVAPATLLVYLGAAGEPAATSLPPGPVALAAALVALLALVGTALVSRRMLRPIAALTTASYGLGEGDLSRRVPVRGRDELAQLAQSFNRMAESLQHGEERQRRMVADVAHELRTPLANLRGYLEALKDGVVEPSPELFASLHEEAVLQQRIVNDLQDLALAEAGALTYHRSGIDLVELLETCRTTHQAAAEAAGVALVVR